MTMLDQFKAYINRYNLLAEGEKVILALSGGIDSMALAPASTTARTKSAP